MFKSKSLNAAFLCLTALPVMAQTYKIAVVGLVHSQDSISAPQRIRRMPFLVY
jgi:hypothetical protein